MASKDTKLQEIHVMVVDHDLESLLSTVKMLESCSYKVTGLEHTFIAMTMLSREKNQFDAVMANIEPTDPHKFKLLEHAVKMAIPIVLMSSDESYVLAKEALGNGALLCLKKPVPKVMFEYLWQHVLREKLNMIKAKQIEQNQEEFGEEMCVEDQNNLNEQEFEQQNEEHYSKGKGEEATDGTNKLKKKEWTEWTLELHEKFVDAVNQLGEGRCYPKEILELMDVPGLTRMQVASHLQKCRSGTWRHPHQRKSSTNNSSTTTIPPPPPPPPPAEPTDPFQPYRPRKFGAMPIVGRKTQPTQHHYHHHYPEFQIESQGLNTNEIEIMQMQMQNMGQFQGFGTMIPNTDDDNNNTVVLPNASIVTSSQPVVFDSLMVMKNNNATVTVVDDVSSSSNNVENSSDLFGGGMLNNFPSVDALLSEFPAAASSWEQEIGMINNENPSGNTNQQQGFDPFGPVCSDQIFGMPNTPSYFAEWDGETSKAPNDSETIGHQQEGMG